MNKLQKSAWINLAVIILCMMIFLPCFLFMAIMNTKGLVYVLVCIVITVFLSPVIYIIHKKKGFEAGLDEREKTIYKRAFTISAYGLAAFLGFACFIPFFILGGQSLIKLYYLPLIFMATLFTAQFIHSSAILIQCALEAEDG